jgi:two-component system phosphate regulon sensor histidine kinase PhoR
MQNWRGEIKRLLSLGAIALLLGWLSGNLAGAIIVALAAFALHNVLQLRKMVRWLEQDPTRSNMEPPESFGLWGNVFDGIYRLQKKERRASAYLENIIDKAQESSAALEMAVVMVDQDNNLDWWNKASEHLLGLQYPDDRNQAVTNLIRDPRFADYFAGEKYDEPLKLNAPGDSNKVLEFQIALFGEHERLMIVRDVTQLHRLELMRKDFIGNVSHELGTPITVIKGYLEALMDNMDSLDQKWQKPIQQMHQQSMRMENIVRDLLLLSSLETKTLPRQQVDVSLATLIAEIKNDSQQVFAHKEHEFLIECEQGLRFRGDRGELYSALSNLVSNAAKYTAANGVIVIKAFADEHSSDFFVDVIDNGMGIEEQHIPRLTERFYRVDNSRSSETGGTGLGLAIVKHILMRHDAELEVSSEVGKGSRFRCRFPGHRISREQASTPAAGNEPASLESEGVEAAASKPAAPKKRADTRDNKSQVGSKAPNAA